MMKKIDGTQVHNRPGALRAQQARLEIIGKKGVAHATLDERRLRARTIGETRPELPWEQALHMICYALSHVDGQTPNASVLARARTYVDMEVDAMQACVSCLVQHNFSEHESLLATAACMAEAVASRRAAAMLTWQALNRWPGGASSPSMAPNTMVLLYLENGGPVKGMVVADRGDTSVFGIFNPSLCSHPIPSPLIRPYPVVHSNGRTSSMFKLAVNDTHGYPARDTGLAW